MGAKEVEGLLLPHLKHPSPAADNTGLVHLTWLRRNTELHTSLCSSLANVVRVTPCTQEYPSCLRCIDITSRFW